MSKEFDVSRLYDRFPFNTTVPARCPSLPTIAFDCRVEGTWLEDNIKNTPFNLVDNRVMITGSDFAKHSAFPFRDVIFIAPVEYKGIRGGHPFLEFENSNRAVIGGREKWGYPKLYADIDFVTSDDGAVQVAVTMGGRRIVDLNWQPDGNMRPGAPTEQPLKLWPHLLLRMLPDASRPGMGFVEVLRRDTSEDLVVLEQKSGRADLKFGPMPEHEIDYCELAKLKIKEVISAQLIISDWVSSEKNGWAQLVDRLL
ncbi:acetoacetate decarboxylase family protein [Leptospira interrogans]